MSTCLLLVTLEALIFKVRVHKFIRVGMKGNLLIRRHLKYTLLKMSRNAQSTVY